MKTRRYWGVVSAQPAEVLALMAQQAEQQALTGVFAPQVYGPPFVPLAAAAMVTRRIQLATGIAIAAARSPFETAMAALDLDRISNGRCVLGLGSSVLSWTRDVFGAADHQPVPHLRETVAAVRHIVRGAHLGLEPFEGRWYRAQFRELQPTPPPVRDDIPIWIAALRGPMVRLAAEIAQGVMGHPMWSVDWAVERIQGDLKDGLDRAGRARSEVDLNLWFWVAPNTDEREAVEDARATVAFYAGIAQYQSFFEAHGFGEVARRLQAEVKARRVLETAALVPDEMVKTFVLCGPPEAVRRRIERAWTVADSMCLVPPAYAVAPEKQVFYAQAIAELIT